MAKERILMVAAVLIMAALVVYGAKRVTKPTELSITKQTIHEETTSPDAIINAEYPVIVGFKSKPAELSINETIKSLTTAAIASFKDETKDAIPVTQAPYQRSEFGSKYEIETVTSTLVSIRFNDYTYSAGAAHPLSYVQSFNYDMASGKTIALADLFSMGSPYLERISEKSIASLQTQFKDELDGIADWIKSGAAPKEENYQTFVIKPEGLLIIFSPYQVGPYVIGIPEVLIPYADLQDMISTQGPLAIFIGGSSKAP